MAGSPHTPSTPWTSEHPFDAHSMSIAHVSPSAFGVKHMPSPPQRSPVAHAPFEHSSPSPGSAPHTPSLTPLAPVQLPFTHSHDAMHAPPSATFGTSGVHPCDASAKNVTRAA